MQSTHGDEARPALLDVPNAQKALGGIGHSMFYELVAEGHLRTVKIGRRTFVTREEIDRYVATLTGAGSREAA